MREYALLALLAVLWGASYLFINLAVRELPPLTLMAARVLIAAACLGAIMALNRQRLPRSVHTWRQLAVQAFFNSIGAWTLLGWGQQFVDAGLASVLNSTSPLFVVVLALFGFSQAATRTTALIGVALGFGGVVVLVGTDALSGLGQNVLGQLACLGGAALYGCAALYGKRFNALGPLITATGTLLCATVVLVPLALLIDQPWTLAVSFQTAVSTLVLSVFCTACALLIYFRLIRTLGAVGVASQAYLRAGVGVLLGVFVLGETLTVTLAIGLAAAIVGVALINWPSRAPQ